MHIMDFKNIKEFADHIPNCIICKKPMDIFLCAMFLDTPNPTYHVTKIRAKITNDTIISDNKNYEFAININDNSIISNQTLINRIIANNLTLWKKCRTCLFHIDARIRKIPINYKQFPEAYLYGLTCNFTN